MGKILEFLGWFFEPRQRMDWKSWRSLVIVFPFMLGVLLVIPQALREKRAAARQQTTQGAVTSYERSNHNLCGYTFSVHERLYNGTSSAPRTDIRIGDQVLVYFDSQDPNVSALEDFSVMSARDESFAAMLLVPITVLVAFISITRFTSTRAGISAKAP